MKKPAKPKLDVVPPPPRPPADPDLIDELPISFRIWALLHRVGDPRFDSWGGTAPPPTPRIVTTTDLVRWRRCDLRQIKGLGKTSIDDLGLALYNCGIRLAPDPPKAPRLVPEKCPTCGGTGHTGRLVPKVERGGRPRIVGRIRPDLRRVRPTGA